MKKLSSNHHLNLLDEWVCSHPGIVDKGSTTPVNILLKKVLFLFAFHCDRTYENYNCVDKKVSV